MDVKYVMAGSRSFSKNEKNCHEHANYLSYLAQIIIVEVKSILELLGHGHMAKTNAMVRIPGILLQVYLLSVLNHVYKLWLGQNKNMCVYCHMLKKIRVGRSEILFFKFYFL